MIDRRWSRWQDWVAVIACLYTALSPRLPGGKRPGGGGARRSDDHRGRLGRFGRRRAPFCGQQNRPGHGPADISLNQVAGVEYRTGHPLAYPPGGAVPWQSHPLPPGR